MRERLSKSWSGFSPVASYALLLGRWLESHKRGILRISWFVLTTALGGAYYFLSLYFALPIVNPLGTLNGGPLVALSNPTLREIAHPISGIFYSAGDASFWQSKRPLGVMIDNHELARPYQFGLQKADLIYEAVAEGGITRLLAVFHGQDVEKLGPVRSSRVYYIDWALEFPAYYAHVGGASTVGPANINRYITVNKVLNLNQFRLGSATFTYGGDIYFRGGAVLAHINYTSTNKLWQAGEALYPGTNKLPSFQSWEFKPEEPYQSRPDVQKISFNFWNLPAYAVEWRYDRSENVYQRFQGGVTHIDQATKKQLAAKNVVLAYMVERSAGDGTAHRLYTTTGQGDAAVYLDGVQVLATWKRAFLSSRMQFYKRGTSEEITFNRGLTWVEIVPK